MKFVRLQFSIRWMFVFMALVAGAVYWFSQPSIVARRYVSALNSGEYAAANRLCADAKSEFPGDWNQRHETFATRASVAPLSWASLRSGTREISVAVDYGDGRGIASCGVDCVAKRNCVEVGLMFP